MALSAVAAVGVAFCIPALAQSDCSVNPANQFPKLDLEGVTANGKTLPPEVAREAEKAVAFITGLPSAMEEYAKRCPKEGPMALFVYNLGQPLFSEFEAIFRIIAKSAGRSGADIEKEAQPHIDKVRSFVEAFNKGVGGGSSPK